MRSRVARCLASKAVVVCAGLPLSMNENGKKPGRDGAASLAGGGPGLAAGGAGTAPDLGCGAGVGSGTFSADADATANIMASTVHIVAASIVVARRPAIMFSCRTRYAPPQSANRALWRIRGYQHRIKANASILNRHPRRRLRRGFRACRRDWA